MGAHSHPPLRAVNPQRGARQETQEVARYFDTLRLLREAKRDRAPIAGSQKHKSHSDSAAAPAGAKQILKSSPQKIVLLLPAQAPSSLREPARTSAESQTILREPVVQKVRKRVRPVPRFPVEVFHHHPRFQLRSWHHLLA